MTAAVLALTALGRLRHHGPSQAPLADTRGTPAPTAPAPRLPATSASGVDVDGGLFVTRGHQLVSVRSANGDNPHARIDGGSGPVDYLVLGVPAAHLVWTVSRPGSGPSLARAFDSRSLEPRTPGIPLGRPATAATVLDGALYVASDRDVVRISAAGAGAVSDTGGSSLAADPARHRLLLLADRDGRAVVSVVGAAGRAVTLPVGSGELAVSAGTVWVSGPGQAGWEVLRLDPRTLRPVAASPAGRSLAAPVTVAATGRRSVILRSGPHGALWCLDARTGAALDSWVGVAGPLVLAPDGTVYSVPADRLPSALVFGGCAG